jgi:multiple sugar transport system permease protein
MDGCSKWGLLRRIVLPISLPGVTAVGLYSFIVAWNDFWFALIYSFGKETRTQSVALGFFINQMGIQWGHLMAGTVLVSIPSILVFSFAQKLLVDGLGEGAVKG